MGHKKLTFSQGLAKALKHEKIRFVMVGAVNTSVDFAVLITLSILLGLPATVANIFSTSCALVVSYLLNKKAVFGNTDPNNRHQIILFVVVTLTGLWIIQGAIIVWLNSLFEALFPQLPLAAALLIAKLLATVVSLIWNYLWYSKVVFKKEPK